MHSNRIFHCRLGLSMCNWTVTSLAPEIHSPVSIWFPSLWLESSKNITSGLAGVSEAILRDLGGPIEVGVQVAVPEGPGQVVEEGHLASLDEGVGELLELVLVDRNERLQVASGGVHGPRDL